jgi:hypothetical protein
MQRNFSRRLGLGISGFLLTVSPVVAQTRVGLDATAGTIRSPFVLAEGSLSQPLATDRIHGGRASFVFETKIPGDFVIVAFVNAPATNSNAFYINIDAEPEDASMVWDVPATKGFEERLVSWREPQGVSAPGVGRKIFHLSAGRHELVVCGSTASTQLRSLQVVPLPTPPQNLHVVTGP